MTRTLLLFFLFSFNTFAEEFLEFGDKNFAAEKTEESKWMLRSGFQFLSYPTALPEFDGQHDKTQTGDLNDLYGLNLAVGREIYWGAGLSSTLLIGGTYFRGIDRNVGIAAEDIDLDVANTRISSAIYTYEASLSLNYLFDNEVVDFQPFVEFGAGAGNAQVEKEYTRKALPTETNGSEDYDIRTDEDFLFSRVSLGLNIISFKGIVTYLKVSALSLSKTNRKTTGSSKLYNSATVVNQNANEENLSESETLTTATIGMGYLF